MANTTYTVLQKWANQYKALEQANRSAESKVKTLGDLGGVGDTTPNGNFTAEGLKSYDQAKLQHLNANAALTTFLRDTNLNYASEAGRLALIAADTTRTPFERNQANVSSQALAEQAAEFLSFKSTQGLSYPTAVEYQVGGEAVVSSSAGLVKRASPTTTVGGLAQKKRSGLSLLYLA